MIFFLFAIYYAITRFSIELFRSDTAPWRIFDGSFEEITDQTARQCGDLSAAQLIGVVIFILGIAGIVIGTIFFKKDKKKAKNAA